MPSTPYFVHLCFATISLIGAVASIVVSIKLGSLKFLVDNYLNGFCVDIWDGFFLSPVNLMGIFFLMFLPIHCYLIQAPHSLLFLTCFMALPSFLFISGTLLEISPVVLPTAVVTGCFIKFGLSEFKLAKRIQSSSRSTKRNHREYVRISRVASSKTFEMPQNCGTTTSPLFKRKRSDS
ncbi:hypothetical protein PPACK8108_LOCUS8527 [Phakopsora pachyrhizi]|uniref:Transmembrane protein n=1 Tax=Phakopsora pachyrhizi TaxID=170000 RepID=A0AAV0AUV2_PHAPC|nr:hypothetical protein PPACK8108_LOCUS8527 [Phakopsora pachyrhizi]